jgi:hypothetical protein
VELDLKISLQKHLSKVQKNQMIILAKNSLSMCKADSFEEAVNICGRLVKNKGDGHSAGLYTSNVPEEAGRREQLFVENVPVGRVFVDSPTLYLVERDWERFQLRGRSIIYVRGKGTSRK